MPFSEGYLNLVREIAAVEFEPLSLEDALRWLLPKTLANHGANSAAVSLVGFSFDAVRSLNARLRMSTEACKKLRNGPEYRSLVLDIMMPTPDGVSSSETNSGLSTGVWVLKQCAQRIKGLPIPVVVLTNRELQDVQAEIEELGFPKDLIVHKPKKKTPAEHCRALCQS